jgi:hypothetical protein
MIGLAAQCLIELQAGALTGAAATGVFVASATPTGLRGATATATARRAP